MSNRPSFQFYPNDWLSSTNIMLMTAAQEGAYIRLLAIAWNSDDCGLDNNIEELARLGRVNSTDVERVLKNFVLRDGRWFNERLVKERLKQEEFRKNAVRAGKASAEKRRQINKNTEQRPLNGRSTDVQRKGNSSSSSSSSSSSPQTPKGVDAEKIKFSPESDEYVLSVLCLELIKRNNPKFKDPNLQKWAAEIDKMIRIDSRTVEEIEFIIRWSQQDSFWKANILSTAKLREKFDQLFAKAKSQFDQSAQKQSKTAFIS